MNLKLRLKLIATVNFTYSEAENFKDVMKKNPGVHLGPGDVVLLQSQSGGQMVFMYRPVDLNFETMECAGARRGGATAYKSVRLRLSRSTWNPLMLQDYANEVGLELEGLRRFAEIMGETKQPVHRENKSKGKKSAKVIELASHRKAA